MLAAFAALLTGTRAGASDLPQLLAFGSSDSCAWCDLLERRVFTSESWRTWAAANVAIKIVDLPRGDGVLAPEVRERNEQLADKYGIEGIPTFVLVSPDGKTELGRVKVPDSSRGLGRDLTAETFIAAVQENIRSAPPADPTSSNPPESRKESTPSFSRIYRFIPVIALLGIAAMLLTDKSKLPLALRGLKKVLGADGTPAASAAPVSVPLWKRLLAFALIVLAFLVAVL